jgi:3-hydroxybutyryl-CoA dehydratase
MADLAVGARATLEHTFTATQVADFARLSGDTNPIHLDPDAARRAGFDREVVHGVLVTGLISRLLGTQLPGPGTILLEQQLKYLRPVYPDERVRATVEVTTVREDKPVFGLRTWVETGEVVLEGQATVVVRRLGVVTAPAAGSGSAGTGSAT